MIDKKKQKIMYSLKIEIDSLPKSLNKKLRSHFHKNKKENDSWDRMIYFKTLKSKPPTPLVKAKIKLIRHSHRTLDYDGLVGSMKPVVDALVDCGVLIDDSWKVLGKWDVDQKFRPKKKGCLLEIEVLEDPEK